MCRDTVGKGEGRKLACCSRAGPTWEFSEERTEKGVEEFCGKQMGGRQRKGRGWGTDSCRGGGEAETLGRRGAERRRVLDDGVI